MANDIKRQFSATFTKKVQGAITRAMVEKATDRANRGLEQDIRRQANRGKDVSDNDFPSYTPGYRIQKAKAIKTGKIGKRTMKKTEYAARKVDNKTRLSGQTHKDVIVRTRSVKLDKGFPEVVIEVDAATQRSKRVVGYLKKNGYDFLGIAKGTTSAGRQQRDNYKRAMLQGLKASGGGKFSINEV